MMSSVGVYVAEGSPSWLRGQLVVGQSVFITMGRFSGALVSAVTFQLDPPTRRTIPVLLSKILPGRSFLQWLDVVDYSGRRSVFFCLIYFYLCRLLVCFTHTHTPPHPRPRRSINPAGSCVILRRNRLNCGCGGGGGGGRVNWMKRPITQLSSI